MTLSFFGIINVLCAVALADCKDGMFRNLVCLCKADLTLCHPAPIERQKNILELSDTDVPEEMETKDGNLLLNCILDSSEMAENWLRDKIRKGKLHPLDTLG